MIQNLLKRFYSSGHNVGDTVRVLRKITASDIRKFVELSGDTNPIHSTAGSERAIVHGAFLNSLVSGVIGTQLPGPGTVVVHQVLNFPNKCFVDDGEVMITVELVEVRKLSRVKFVCEVVQTNKVVLYGDARLIIRTKY